MISFMNHLIFKGDIYFQINFRISKTGIEKFIFQMDAMMERHKTTKEKD